MNKTAAFVLALGALGCGGCHLELLRDNPLGCRSDEQSLVRDTLYFGASIPGGGEVDESAWKQFENEFVAPAFPSGFTVIDGKGHWRGEDGHDRAEHTRIVTVLHSDSVQDAQALRAIAKRYVDRFHQESVLRERNAVCAQF